MATRDFKICNCKDNSHELLYTANVVNNENDCENECMPNFSNAFNDKCDTQPVQNDNFINDNSDITDILDDIHSSSNDSNDILHDHDTLAMFCKKNYKNLKIFHLNVNSLRNKLPDVTTVLKFVDILCMTESKLDESFLNAQFNVDEFKIIRRDRNEHGGGIFCYVRSVIPHRNRPDLSFNHSGIESVVIEVSTKMKKVLIACVYRPPSIHVKYLQEAIDTIYCKGLVESKHVYMLGDLNVNLLRQPNDLTHTIESLNLYNVIKDPTCFKNVRSPTLLDVIFTNSKYGVADKFNSNVGISDFHHLVGFATKMHIQRRVFRSIMYRSYKHFDINAYTDDLQKAPFNVSDIFDEVDDKLWCHNMVLRSVIDHHAPLKIKNTKGQTAFYMNNELRKAINVKGMLHRKYNKVPTNENWGKFRDQRNKVNKMKRNAMSTYFDKKCNNVSQNNNSKMFWNAVKPYFSSKASSTSDPVSLLDNDDHVVNNQDLVCNMFNDHFVNITNDMCENIEINELNVESLATHYSTHPSVVKILSQLSGSENSNSSSSFVFHSVLPEQVKLKLKCLNTRKACGYDLIPAKLIKCSADILCYTLTPIINYSFQSATFPSILKNAEVSPIFKKDDPLSISNYRPVSVLTSLSKIFESIILDQLNVHFQNIFNNSLAAFRKKYSCENVLLQCIEDWKMLLDKGENVGCLLIDLSKAFDCLPHGLLIAKLQAYGLDNNACTLIHSYLTDRMQRVKLYHHKSEWRKLLRGVPQGSLLGPLLFNVFINDYFDFVECQVYNYADDVTLSCHSECPLIIKSKLENEAVSSIEWFRSNFMKANPAKFQTMTISKQDHKINIIVNDNIIESSECVKLLGVHIDNKLTFNHHVSVLCKKVGKQINALCRMSRYLNQKSLLKVYESFIKSNFNYASSVWHLCGIGNTRRIEKLQERALRIIFKDYNSRYTNFLRDTNLPTLYLERKRKLLIMVFKIIHDLAKPLAPDFFEFITSSYDLRNTSMLSIPLCKTSKYGSNSVLFQGASLWNKLPNDIRECNDVESFRNTIVKWNGPVCLCGSCFSCIGF